MVVAVDFLMIPEMFDRITTKHALGERRVLMHEVDKQYRSISCSDLRRKVDLFALGLSSIGVKKDHRVRMMKEGRRGVKRVLSAVVYRPRCHPGMNVPLFPFGSFRAFRKTSSNWSRSVH